MPMTTYTGETEIITNLGTTPAERGLETDEFKAKFDEGLKAFVTWFNDTHKTEFDAHLADDVQVTNEGQTEPPHGLAKNKLDATTAPTVNDDSGDGYSINSAWVDITNDEAYICLDATVGAAIWKAVTNTVIVPVVKVTHNVAQSILNANPTILSFNTEVFDNDTMHDNVTNNSRLTCKTAGIYEIYYDIAFAANTTGLRRVEILLNGTTSLHFNNQPGGVSGNATTLHASIIHKLNVNDYIEMRARQGSGGTLDVISDTWSPLFGMVKIG